MIARPINRPKRNLTMTMIPLEMMGGGLLYLLFLLFLLAIPVVIIVLLVMLVRKKS